MYIQSQPGIQLTHIYIFKHLDGCHQNTFYSMYTSTQRMSVCECRPPLWRINQRRLLVILLAPIMPNSRNTLTLASRSSHSHVTKIAIRMRSKNVGRLFVAVGTDKKPQSTCSWENFQNIMNFQWPYTVVAAAFDLWRKICSFSMIFACIY